MIADLKAITIKQKKSEATTFVVASFTFCTNYFPIAGSSAAGIIYRALSKQDAGSKGKYIVVLL